MENNLTDTLKTFIRIVQINLTIGKKRLYIREKCYLYNQQCEKCVEKSLPVSLVFLMKMDYMRKNGECFESFFKLTSICLQFKFCYLRQILNFI